MSTNQLHGKTFEREVITKCFGLTEEQASELSNTSMFDIPFGITTCQHPTGDPVSIKTAAAKVAAGAAIVCLSDARRVWSWDRPLILVVGLYDQVGKVKRFHTVFEFHIQLTDSERRRLYGDLTLDEVTHFHETLKLFGPGQHLAASAWAKAHKAELSTRATGAIQLNPKIDSKRQRRLQCSSPLEQLRSACDDVRQFTQETGGYRGLTMPFEVLSSRRERKPRTSTKGAAADCEGRASLGLKGSEGTEAMTATTLPQGTAESVC